MAIGPVELQTVATAPVNSDQLERTLRQRLLLRTRDLAEKVRLSGTGRAGAVVPEMSELEV